MKQPSAGTISDHLSELYGYKVTESEISPVIDSELEQGIDDATRKFLVPLPNQNNGFMLLSGTGNPQIISRAMSNIKIARETLSPELSRHILPSILNGVIKGFSFAIWEIANPFHTESRVRNIFRRLYYAKAIISWSNTVTVETMQPAGDTRIFHKSLNTIAGDELLSDIIRQHAQNGLARLASEKWIPVHSLDHGDFWTGNLLLSNTGNEPEFYVVDWAGMRCKGFPFIDQARMLNSLRRSHKFNHNCIEQLRSAINCEQQDIMHYILSALGQTGHNLEFFPPHRYRSMVTSLYKFMTQYLPFTQA